MIDALFTGKAGKKTLFILICFSLTTFYLYPSETTGLTLFYHEIKRAYETHPEHTFGTVSAKELFPGDRHSGESGETAPGSESKNDPARETGEVFRFTAAEESVFFSEEIIQNAFSFLDTRFLAILSSSEIFTVIPVSSPAAAFQGKEAESGISVKPVPVDFRLVESEKSGYFFKCALDVIVSDSRLPEEETVFKIEGLGSGESSVQALSSSLDSVVRQFEYLLVNFETWSERFRIIDIYRGTAVINTGKTSGIRKGDILHSYDYQSGKITGSFVIERSEDDISFARVLEQKKKPLPGDPLYAERFRGGNLTGYGLYFSGERFSGCSAGLLLSWSGSLYVFNPVAGFEFLSVSEESGGSYELSIPYAGFKIVRHIGLFTLYSMITAGKGYIPGGGWDYTGGQVRAGLSRRTYSRFLFSAEAGYAYWHSKDVSDYPDIAGFLLGAGVTVKF